MCPITLLLALTEIQYKTPDALSLIFLSGIGLHQNLFAPCQVFLIIYQGEQIIQVHPQELLKMLLRFLTLVGVVSSSTIIEQ